jgi:hypothetical protein
MAAAERLLIVEEAFTAKGRGVMVSPKITVANPGRAPFAVRLRLPNGDERDASAVLEVSHIRGPLPPFAMIRLIDLTPDDVPPGTEVWRAET